MRILIDRKREWRRVYDLPAWFPWIYIALRQLFSWHSALFISQSLLTIYSSIVQSMSNFTEEAASRILKCLAEESSVNSYEFSHRANIDHQVIVGAIKSLLVLGEVSGKCCTFYFKQQSTCFRSQKHLRLLTLNSCKRTIGSWRWKDRTLCPTEATKPAYGVKLTRSKERYSRNWWYTRTTYPNRVIILIFIFHRTKSLTLPLDSTKLWHAVGSVSAKGSMESSEYLGRLICIPALYIYIAEYIKHVYHVWILCV